MQDHNLTQDPDYMIPFPKEENNSVPKKEGNSLEEKEDQKKMVESLPKKEERVDPIPSHLIPLVEEMKDKYDMSPRLANAFVRWAIKTKGEHFHIIEKMRDSFDEESQYQVVKVECEKRLKAWKAFMENLGFFPSVNEGSWVRQFKETRYVVDISLPTKEMVIKHGINNILFLILSPKGENSVYEADFGREVMNIIMTNKD